MHFRNLGKNNLKVSVLCLGTMMFGDQTSLDEETAIVADARPHGVNYIDTTDNYSKGGSETRVGGLLKGQRHDWVLANSVVNSVIAGLRTLRQWQDYLPALDYEDETLVNNLVKPGRPSTPGYTDPVYYPSTGRLRVG